MHREPRSEPRRTDTFLQVRGCPPYSRMTSSVLSSAAGSRIVLRRPDDNVDQVDGRHDPVDNVPRLPVDDGDRTRRTDVREARGYLKLKHAFPLEEVKDP